MRIRTAAPPGKLVIWKRVARKDSWEPKKVGLGISYSSETCGQRCGEQTPSARKLFFRTNLLYVPNIKM